MSLPGSATTAPAARPTDFGAPFSPAVIAGIAAGGAVGVGLLLVGFAYLLAYVTLGKDEEPEFNNALGVIDVSDPVRERVAGYEPFGARKPPSNDSTNELLRQPSQSARGAEISTPMNLDLVGFTPEAYETVSTRLPRSGTVRSQQQAQASYFVNPPSAGPRETPTPQQRQGSFYVDSPYSRQQQTPGSVYSGAGYDRPREPRYGQQDQGAYPEAMVRKETQRGTIQSQTSYYSDKSDPPYARLRGTQGSSRFSFQDEPSPDRAAVARRREEAIARKQEANYYSDGRYTGQAAYDRRY